MIEKPIEQDIGSYQTKFLGPLTFRQTVCLALGIPICWGMYRYLSPILSRDLTGFLVAIPAFFCAAVGWCRPFGMKTEKYIRAVLFCRFLCPPSFSYQTADSQEQKQLARKQKNAAAGKQKYRISRKSIR